MYHVSAQGVDEHIIIINKIKKSTLSNSNLANHFHYLSEL